MKDQRKTMIHNFRGGYIILFIAPALITYFIFYIWPSLGGLRLSFFDWNGIGKMTFIGLGNYKEILNLNSSETYRALFHNFLFFIGSLTLEYGIALPIAIILWRKPFGYRIYRTIFFMPVLLSLVATGYIWNIFLDPNIGLINIVLRKIGLEILAKVWFGDPKVALAVIICVASWQSMGVLIILFLAGLQTIPQNLYEAAKVDGASPWYIFIRIIFPLLGPSHTIILILAFTGTMKVFDIVAVLTGMYGNPSGATDVISLIIYRAAFFGFSQGTQVVRIGYAAALGIIMSIITGFVVVLMLRILSKREIRY